MHCMELSSFIPQQGSNETKNGAQKLAGSQSVFRIDLAFLEYVKQVFVHTRWKESFI